MKHLIALDHNKRIEVSVKVNKELFDKSVKMSEDKVTKVSNVVWNAVKDIEYIIDKPY